MSPNSSKILVTGANGFVGRALCTEAVRRGFDVHALTRQAFQMERGVEVTVLANWHESAEKLAHCFCGVDTVFHLAARVHVMHDTAADPIVEYRKTNVHLTQHLLMLAQQAGVRRFVYLSSIKVNGEQTKPNSPFNAEDAVHPTDPYAQSKWEAEECIAQFCDNHPMQFTIIRPPLVYGPGVGANFLALLKLIRYPVILPFRSIENRRSMISRANLVDLLLHSAQSPMGQNQTFLASDGADLSTAELLAKLKHLMRSKVVLVPVPLALLQFGLTAIGKHAIAQRLLDSLEVDIQKTIKVLNWHPPQTVDEGLRETVRAFEAPYETRF